MAQFTDTKWHHQAVNEFSQRMINYLKVNNQVINKYTLANDAIIYSNSGLLGTMPFSESTLAYLGTTYTGILIEIQKLA